MTGAEAAPSSSATPPGGLRAIARKGFVWQSVAFASARLSVLLSTIVLARYLGPGDYGFVALAVVLVTTLTTISDAGVSQALVYLETSERLVGSALVVALGASGLLAAAWMVAAPLVAAQVGHADDAGLLVALGSVIVLTAIGRVPDALLRRQMLFSRRLPAELARGLTRGGVAITLAVQGVGPWSLVIGEITGALAYAVVSQVMARRSRLRAARGSVEDARLLLAYGIPAAANGALATAVLNVDYVVIATMLGTTAVGIYFVGFRVPELVVLSVFQVFSQVAFPVYTRARTEADRLSRAFLTSLRLQTYYGFTAGAIIAVTSGTMVPVLFGDEYGGSVAVMAAIAVYVVLRSLAAGAVDVFKAVGKPQVAVRIAAARFVVLVPLLFLGTRWGVTGVAVTQAVVAMIFALLTQRVVSGMLDLRWGDVGMAVLPSMVVALGAAIAAGLVELAVDDRDLVALVMSTGAGLLTAAALVLVIDRRTLKQVVRG